MGLLGRENPSMKLVMFQTVGDPRLGCQIDDRLVDLNLAYEAMLRDAGRVKARERAAVMIPPVMEDFLAGEDEALDLARQTVDWVAGKGSAAEPLRGLDIVRPADSVKLLPPLSRPEKIICAAVNYWDALNKRGKEPPAEPKVFSKFANSICGWDDDVIRPTMTQALGYEVELAVVIGRICKNVREEDALDVLAGYMTYNDITASDLTKRDGQNTRGKGFDTFSVMGPWLVTRDEIDDPHDLDLRLSVDGRVLQDGNTRDLVYDVRRLVAFCSQVFTLRPGDVIATGSPLGLATDYDPPAFLEPGNVMETEVVGLGVCRNRIVQEA